MGDLLLGTVRPDALYAGAQAVSKVYWGTEQVWPLSAATAHYDFLTVTGTSWTQAGDGEVSVRISRAIINPPDQQGSTPPTFVAGDHWRLTNESQGGAVIAEGPLSAVDDTTDPGWIRLYWNTSIPNVSVAGETWRLTPFDALDAAILALNPTHYWKLDDSAGPFADYGSDPVPLTIDTDMGILTRQTVAGALTGVSMPLDSSLRGVGCTPDPNVNGESYLFFTDVNDTTAFEVAANVIGNSNMRLRSQYSTGVSQYPNWRITGTNRNPASLAATGVPAMYAARNSGSGAGRVFSEVEYPTGGGSSGSQNTHPHAGADLLLTSMGATGSVSVARVAVFAAVLDDLDLGTIFDAYTNL